MTKEGCGCVSCAGVADMMRAYSGAKYHASRRVGTPRRSLGMSEVTFDSKTLQTLRAYKKRTTTAYRREKTTVIKAVCGYS